jgi:hypothetical protein
MPLGERLVTFKGTVSKEGQGSCKNLRIVCGYLSYFYCCAKISCDYLISKVTRIILFWLQHHCVFFQSFQNASTFIIIPIYAQLSSVKFILKLLRYVSVLMHHLQGF